MRLSASSGDPEREYTLMKSARTVGRGSSCCAIEMQFYVQKEDGQGVRLKSSSNGFLRAAQRCHVASIDKRWLGPMI